jgi:hypothetical protein
MFLGFGGVIERAIDELGWAEEAVNWNSGR